MIVIPCLPLAAPPPPLAACPFGTNQSVTPVAAPVCQHGEPTLSRTMKTKPLWPREGSEIAAPGSLRMRCG
jgi:hypothetical protein